MLNQNKNEKDSDTSLNETKHANETKVCKPAEDTNWGGVFKEVLTGAFEGGSVGAATGAIGGAIAGSAAGGVGAGPGALTGAGVGALVGTVGGAVQGFFDGYEAQHCGMLWFPG